MKVYYTLISVLFLSTLLTSCHKDKEVETSSNNPATTPLPVIFTANMNFVDEGSSVTMNGVSDYNTSSYTLATAGYILHDSLLTLTFKDESTHLEFVLNLLLNGADIQPGTYSFSGSTNDYTLAMSLENTQNDLTYTFSNWLTNAQYQGQVIVPNGTLTITSVTQTTISATLNADLYKDNTVEMTHKMTISNGSMNCDIIRL